MEFLDKAGVQAVIDETKRRIKNSASSYAPLGTVVPYAGSTAPNGWLICDGSAVSRETYAGLFAVIGTTYGAGDGSTTFNLPNLVDKFVEGGSSSGTIKSAGLPNITGSFISDTYGQGSTLQSGTGAFTTTGSATISPPAIDTAGAKGTRNGSTASFNASKSSSIYGNSTTVQPPAVIMVYIIKASIVADVSDGEEQRFNEIESDVAGLKSKMPEIRSGVIAMQGANPQNEHVYDITFSTPMPNTSYSISIQRETTSTYWADQSYSISSKTVNGFKIRQYNSSSQAFSPTNSYISWTATLAD